MSARDSLWHYSLFEISIWDTTKRYYVEENQKNESENVGIYKVKKLHQRSTAIIIVFTIHYSLDTFCEICWWYVIVY